MESVLLLIGQETIAPTWHRLACCRSTDKSDISDIAETVVGRTGHIEKGLRSSFDRIVSQLEATLTGSHQNVRPRHLKC